ncbi:MAG: ABC transporter permease [Halobacteriales archaeon]
MARRNLVRNPLRSGLACFGIVIGVVAIASLGILGFTLQAGFMQNMGDAANQVEVAPATETTAGLGAGTVTQDTLSDRELRDIRQASAGASVIAIKEEVVEIEYGDDATSRTVYAVENPGALFNASEGRVPASLSRGVLAGSSLAETADVNVGSALTVDNSSYRVVGTLEEQPWTAPVNPNFNLVVPEELLRDEGYSRVVVEQDSAEAANETAQRINESLNRREEVVEVRENSDLIEQVQSQQRLLSLFLIAVGSISLFVAGVSILNVMLMSTVERREEIGVLRAVGVQRTSVLKILLAEATLLGVVGGTVGVVISLAVGGVINHFMLDDALMVLRAGNLRYLAIAMGFAVLISLLSGVYPAWKAANERPVEALRG